MHPFEFAALAGVLVGLLVVSPPAAALSCPHANILFLTEPVIVANVGAGSVIDELAWIEGFDYAAVASDFTLSLGDATHEFERVQ